MPTTRKTTHAAGPVRQSKLSFAHRVTKPAAKAAGKDLSAAPSPLSKEAFPAETTRKSTAPISEDKARADEVELDDEEDAGEDEEQQSLAVPISAPPPPVKSDAEIEAEKVSDAQVRKYWRALDAERLAPRVHQEDLDVSEKVLRYFDVSSQYGPCIGITRMRRWQRAARLGLNPPIEVLAVLLREENVGNSGIERAHMDEIMNSTVIGAGAA